MFTLKLVMYSLLVSRVFNCLIRSQVNSREGQSIIFGYFDVFHYLVINVAIVFVVILRDLSCKQPRQLPQPQLETGVETWQFLVGKSLILPLASLKLEEVVGRFLSVNKRVYKITDDDLYSSFFSYSYLLVVRTVSQSWKC